MQLLWQSTYTLEQIHRVAAFILELAAEKKVFLLEAPLGGGKTTLIRSLIEELEGEELSKHVSSPTFTIVQVYTGKENYYHIDAYRLQSSEEILYLGIDEYLDGESFCFIEWPHLVLPFIKVPYIFIELEHLDWQQRLIKIFKS
ncbi:MAG: tRNA (adenosine(37)-N6)-threonylcarbamoyltransferase complex ATPase subunit type 1 TsaE [Bacteroidia bacterium]|nr:tRNA (adenosine(37)-N6)-threonylcarbamoyltransferase complex ATPase subunit type 1 TsaE [Bacteroidia bacterium]MDW8157777.1 tRNA (adenosine(37)-N6)-threonylcarbamoyltransferase complex ATPase subunit type 1 TsaE [Bacteroidia bacterium]